VMIWEKLSRHEVVCFNHRVCRVVHMRDGRGRSYAV